MANVAAPSGFRVARSQLSSVTQFATVNAQILYSYSTKIARGDPVLLASSGYIQVYANGGSQIYGIFDGCEYYDPVAQKYQWFPYWPAPGSLTAGPVIAKVYTDPFITFECQATTGGAFAQSNVGQNIDIVTGSSGAPNTSGQSTCSLDLANAATTSTLPFQITGVVGTPAINYLYSSTVANPWLEVRMNTSPMLNTTGV